MPPTICDATTIGSIPDQGVAPCVWRPFTTISKRCELAIAPSGRIETWPVWSSCMTCSPKIASTSGFFNTPSRTIMPAPPSSPGGAPSSAGWKMNLTVPGSCARTLGQHLRHAHQNRDVVVVAARVHHADVLAEILARRRRRVRQTRLLHHRQRVHVGAQAPPPCRACRRAEFRPRRCARRRSSRRCRAS